MKNAKRSPINKTPGLEDEYDFSNSRRSSTSLSLVGVGETPSDLREINVYDRVQVQDSPISPPVHPRCRSTTEYTTTEKSFFSTTPTPKFQCTRSQCPSRNPPTVGKRSAQCSPRCFRSPPTAEQQFRSPAPAAPVTAAAPATAAAAPPEQLRSPPQQCTSCGTKSPSTCPIQCATQSPCTATATATTTTATTTQCTTKSPCPTGCTTRSPCMKCSSSPRQTNQCTSKATASTCPTRTTTYTPSTPTSTTGSPMCRSRSPTCATRPPTLREAQTQAQCVTRSPTCTMRTTNRCTSRSPECTTRTTPICSSTQCTPQTTRSTCSPTCGSSPGTQSMDSRGAQCQLDACRDTRRDNVCCKDDQQQKLCPLELCKMRAGLGPAAGAIGGAAAPVTAASASRSICSSPTRDNNSTKRVPFPPSRKTEDDSGGGGGGGVVRWTEKCSQRCLRPTWNSNRWNCDKPATRPCVDCTGAHPPISRCAQDYDSHRFSNVEGRAMRKCDCCDKRSYQPQPQPQPQPPSSAPIVQNPMPSYQTIDRGPPPMSNCGCDGYARGINHFRKPPAMPQNPFDNSSSAYFNRLHKGLPFSNQPPPPPPPAPSFNPMPQPPFNPPPPQFNHAVPNPNVSTVTTRDNSLNVLQDNGNFSSSSSSSPIKGCAGCDPNAPDSPPNQNINIVTNPHMFNSSRMYLPHDPSTSNMPLNHNRNYLP